MSLNSLFERLVGKSDKSAKAAKDRLRFVLMHDRTDIPAPTMDAIRLDIFKVLSRHLDIDEAMLDVSLERAESSYALVASIPIRRVRTEEEAQHQP